MNTLSDYLRDFSGDIKQVMGEYYNDPDYKSSDVDDAIQNLIEEYQEKISNPFLRFLEQNTL